VDPEERLDWGRSSVMYLKGREREVKEGGDLKRKPLREKIQKSRTCGGRKSIDDET